MAKFNHINVRGTKKVPSAFGNVFINADSISAAKTVIFPDGYLNGATPEPNLAFKVVFVNGHNAANSASYLSLNGVVVVSNQNGTLAPLPIHAMTEGGATVYKVLNPHVVLELYYTANYDGSNHAAFVVVGNPVVLSSVDYTIYADGKIGDGAPGDIKPRAADSVPYGWLLCDGQAVDRTKYAALFAKIGVTYGDGDGVSTFNVPDMRGRAVMGADASNPLGTSQVDQNQGHTHSMSHTHTRGTMEITGRDAIAWAGVHRGAINNGGTREGALSAETQYTNAGGNSDAWGNAMGGEGSIVPLGIAFKASLGWSGSTSEPSNGRTGPSGENEARPKNVRMNWIIKY